MAGVWPNHVHLAEQTAARAEAAAVRAEAAAAVKRQLLEEAAAQGEEITPHAAENTALHEEIVALKWKFAISMYVVSVSVLGCFLEVRCCWR